MWRRLVAVNTPWSAGSDLRGRMARHFGRRGTFLCLYSLVWMAIGVNIATVPMKRFEGDNPSALRFIEMSWVGWLWVSCGVIALTVGMFRRRLGNRDEWGFNALLMPAMLWSGTFMWSWLSFVFSDGAYGRENAWLGCVVYLMAIMSILVVSGWSDPSDENREIE